MNKLRIRTGDLLEINKCIYQVRRVDVNHNIYYYYGDNVKRLNRFDFFRIDRVYRKIKDNYELIYEEVFANDY